VKNHDFTPKNLIFPIAEGGAKIFEVFRVKNHDDIGLSQNRFRLLFKTSD
jgi:hypothetical protein